MNSEQQFTGSQLLDGLFVKLDPGIQYRRKVIAL